MPEQTEVLGLEEIEYGQMKSVTVKNQRILIAKTEDGIFATSDICPHMGGILSKGILKGTVVTCPKHGSQFDLSGGHVVRWTNWSGILLTVSKTLKSPKSLQTYPVKVEGNKITIEI